MEELERYAEINDIPIMMPDGIEFLVHYIETHPIKTILEIGTAIGYSAIKMALVSKDIHVTSIERDSTRFEEAKKNVKKFGLDKQITLILDDAMNVLPTETYDLIFIDAAKSQYIKFFEQFSIYLKKDGVIVSDNLDFHGYTKQVERIESRNLRQLIGKLRKYIEYLENNKEFHTDFYEVGDGIGMSSRIND